MSTITIIEGNSNDKDNTRAYMVKGIDGVSPTVETSKTGTVATVTVTDGDGDHTFTVNDGVSPTVETSKTGGVTTVTITDAEGTHTATINDGEVSEAELQAGLATKSNVGHNHDDRYYTETEVDNFLITQSQTIQKTDSNTTYNITFKRNVNVVTVDIEANFPANFVGKVGLIDIGSQVPTWVKPSSSTSTTLDRVTNVDYGATASSGVRGLYNLKIYGSSSSYKLDCEFSVNTVSSLANTMYFSLRYIL